MWKAAGKEEERDRGTSDERTGERRGGCKLRVNGPLCNLSLTGGLEAAPASSDSPFPPFTPSAVPRLGSEPTLTPPSSTLHLLRALWRSKVVSMCQQYTCPYLDHDPLVLDRAGEEYQIRWRSARNVDIKRILIS